MHSVVLHCYPIQQTLHYGYTPTLHHCAMTLLVISCMCTCFVLFMLSQLMPAFMLCCTDPIEPQDSDIVTHFAASFSRLHSQFHRSASSTKAHSLLQILSETSEAEVQLHCVTELGQASTLFPVETLYWGALLFSPSNYVSC